MGHGTTYIGYIFYLEMMRFRYDAFITMSILIGTIRIVRSKMRTIANDCLEIDCFLSRRSYKLDVFLNRWHENRLSLTATRRQK